MDGFSEIKKKKLTRVKNLVMKEAVVDTIELQQTIKEGLEDKVLRLTENCTKVLSLDVIKENDLWWGGNGVGDRWANKKFNYSTIFSKKVTDYSENEEDSIPMETLKQFRETVVGSSGILGIYVYSKRINVETRPIREDISIAVKKMACVSCGSHSELVCDHKNDFYNDPRVLDTATQRLDDFQSLCNRCNLLKRQICKREKETGVLYSAKQIPKYAVFDFEFTWEKKTFDLSDKDCKKGTYWYDPIEFSRNIYMHMKGVKEVA